MSGRAAARLIAGLAVLAGLGIVAAANVHLVSVAVSSQPDCVAEAEPAFRPARRSC